MFGDQLSIKHLESMIPYLLEMLGDTKTMDAARLVLKEMDKIIPCAGDLHVNMHLLDALFFCAEGTVPDAWRFFSFLLFAFFVRTYGLRLRGAISDPQRMRK